MVLADGKTPADYAGSIDSFGAAKLDSGSDTQVDVNLPSISSGLVGDNVAVKNRYLMPIASSRPSLQPTVRFTTLMVMQTNSSLIKKEKKMKSIKNILGTASMIALTLSATSCTDGNDWDVDGSLSRLFGLRR